MRLIRPRILTNKSKRKPSNLSNRDISLPLRVLIKPQTLTNKSKVLLNFIKKIRNKKKKNIECATKVFDSLCESLISQA